ncbi:AAA family ATPase [Mycobacterium intracellulare]|uniref:AAA family ATPase n=1 Tax=Mycobacterium intracellulare TaxID=1767 RepID=UPI0035DAF690|nr:AAA family ATPase [Mycobacterium intracellulare]
MRVKAISVENIGGLFDQRIELPNQPFVAFAGPNGTGKTKLLAAMIGSWAGILPTPRDGKTASVSLDVEFAESERAALVDLSAQIGWHIPGSLPTAATLVARRSAIAGYQRMSVPNIAVLTGFFENAVFLQQHPSLNPVYLPAERRLLPPAGRGSPGIDLAQLADAMAFEQARKSRQSVQNYGRLDDQEFEQFAKALCVAHSLPDDPDDDSGRLLSRVQWPEFQETVDELLHPKRLLPLTRAHPDQLRIRLPDGGTHQVADLSSGERQAMVIVSRVLRAGAGQSLVIIDEPDAYLHPNLSQRLMQTLEKGIGEAGQLIIATHSPSILDRVRPSAIFRLDYDQQARPLLSQTGLYELYRTTGFRASALTQSELLVVSEGDLEDAVLEALFPRLSRASLQHGPGRDGVLQRVKHLLDYNVPVLGLIDRDVEPPAIDPQLKDHILVLPTADLEGAFLSDDVALKIIVDSGFAKPAYADVNKLKVARDELFHSLRDNTIAELAQRQLRKEFGVKWPPSRGDDPIDRLMNVASATSNPARTDIQAAVETAEQKWEACKAEPWKIVRGKYILGAFTDKCTNWKSGSSLLAAVAKKQPELVALKDFGAAVDRLLPGPTGQHQSTEQ